MSAVQPHADGQPPSSASAIRPLRSRIVARLILTPEISLVAALVIYGAVVEVRNPDFLHYENLILTLKSAAPTFVIAVPMAFALIGGGIDLSVGSMSALGGLVTPIAMSHNIPVPIAILMGLGACAIAGAINGVLIARAHIPPLIVTLGALYVIRGVTLLLTNGEQVFPLPNSFDNLGQGNLFSVPFLVIYAVVVGVIAHVVLAHSTYGYHLRAVGGNANAARAAGIHITRIRISLYVLTALGAAAAGIMMSSFIGDGDPSSGQGLELSVIAAVIVGGTSLFGAIGSVSGTALGVVLLAVVTNGLLLMSVSPYFQFVVLGSVVIGAVGLDQVRRSQFWRRGTR